ncbi:LLM class flavin-dependent oxidoreductase [Capillimicrobium parvum]|uniref:Coenzyme F420-dependent oxidoreductase n=1 Tax=Capillimicrobium parvum TaxID=2884022 RepID=A0A9E6XXZ3_9ACTN|nr:LLM class flavin-dependent oxidoreductase [Capillimicrobium parvum]UGS36527.1 Putative coenzyme F420-dependent oxidoreductase [Capillimicrobium parvum]
MKMSAYLYPKPGEGEFEKFIDSVKAAEEAGYDRAWVFDSQMLWKDVYVYMSHALAVTERIALGTGVTNPFTRHFTVTANAHATLNQIYPGRVLFGIGRGDSARRTLGLHPFPTASFKEVVRDIQTLMAGGSVGIVDHTGKTGPETHIVWAKEHIPTMMSATGPKNLRLAGALADIVQLQVGTHPDSIRWALEYVREGADEAGRNFDDIEIGCFTAMFVGEDQEAAWEFCRFSPNIAANQFADTVKYNPGVELPGPIDRLVNTPRATYDYWGGHCESDAEHMVLPGEVVDDFSIAGPRDKCLEKIKELAAVGVEEIAPGVLNGEVEQILKVGREIIPETQAIEATRWSEVLGGPGVTA